MNENKSNLDKFVDCVYDNFIDLRFDERLKHTKEEIKRIMMSKTLMFDAYYVENKIVAYIICESIKLNDNRNVLYIYYLYVAPKYRKKGIGRKLLDRAIEYGYKNKYDNVMLTCDTENTKLKEFYEINLFMPDMQLRRYDKHDVYSRVL